MNQGVFEREQVWKTKKQGQVKQGSRLREIIAGAAAALTILAFLVGRYTGSSPVGPLRTQNQALTAQMQGLNHTVAQYQQNLIHCHPYDDVAGPARALVARGKFEEAAALAEMYLGSKQHPACPGSALVPLWYTASLDAVYSTPVGSPLDQTPVLRWESIQQKAIRFGLGQGDQQSALTVFTFAYTNGIWSLARASFITALRAQLISVDDRTTLAKYYSTLRNIGHVLAFHFEGSARRSGLQTLATANAIGGFVQRGEAGADLTTLLGSNTHRWPSADLTDPVLAALKR
ncbi:MAG: hypothetical protein M3Z66_10040 [Chloroflexota bacterium]|nr:hypothetical protein [Chloroflexota bacterium]